MPVPPPDSPGRIIGIGGIFFKSADKDALEAWYRDKLGIKGAPHQGVSFPWSPVGNPDKENCTAWSIFPADTDYFGSGPAPFMINYIVDDLDAFLEKLVASGAVINPSREAHEYGKFAWIHDPDGNKIELWQPC